MGTSRRYFLYNKTILFGLKRQNSVSLESILSLNLLIDYYKVGNTVVQGESTANWLDLGTGAAAFDGWNTRSASGRSYAGLWWNASLRAVHISNKGLKTVKRATYSLAGQPIAQKVSGDPVASNNGTFYIYTDHLGSPTMVTTNSAIKSRQRYYPFGEVQTDSGADLTSRGYTGHVENRGIGLTYMNARFYSPYLNRMLTADTIIPDPTNPQSWNRYSYVENNPKTSKYYS